MTTTPTTKGDAHRHATQYGRRTKGCHQYTPGILARDPLVRPPHFTPVLGAEQETCKNGAGILGGAPDA